MGFHIRPEISFRRDSINRGLRFKRLKLIKLSHKPQGILDAVKEFTSQIDPVQLYHKQEFVAIYKRWAGKKTLKNEGRFRNFSEDLEIASDALDGFFFGGSISADLKAQNDIFYGDDFHPDCVGLCGMTRASDDGDVVIYIDTSPSTHATVQSILETLAHEMAHAIYESFKCSCESCIRTTDRWEILGPDWHGELWSKMAEHMRATIQAWDNDLANFWNDGDIERFYANLNG